MPGFLFEQTVRVAGTAPRTPTPVATSRRKIRNVTLKKRLHARCDIPVVHTLRKYTMVCVDNFKKIFCARVAKRTDSPTFVSAE
jgi:hypothetical protein